MNSLFHVHVQHVHVFMLMFLFMLMFSMFVVVRAVRLALCTDQYWVLAVVLLL